MRILGILFYVILSFSLQAQFTGDLKHSISLDAYNFINPGINYRLSKDVDANTPVLGIAAPKSSDFQVSANVSLYWDPFSHVALQNFYNLEYDLRLIGNFYIDYGLGAGFQTNFTKDNYVFNEDFEIEKRILNAHIYALGNLYLGARVKNDITDRSTFFRSNLYFLFPYNTIVLPTFSFSIGKTF